MTDRMLAASEALAAQSGRSAPAHKPPAAQGSARAGAWGGRAGVGAAALSPQGMLALQRAAGNRAAARLNVLARCPGCGGTCGDEEEALEEGDDRGLGGARHVAPAAATAAAAR